MRVPAVGIWASHLMLNLGFLTRKIKVINTLQELQGLNEIINMNVLCQQEKHLTNDVLLGSLRWCSPGVVNSSLKECDLSP